MVSSPIALSNSRQLFIQKPSDPKCQCGGLCPAGKVINELSPPWNGVQPYFQHVQAHYGGLCKEKCTINLSLQKCTKHIYFWWVPFTHYAGIAIIAAQDIHIGFSDSTMQVKNSIATSKVQIKCFFFFQPRYKIFTGGCSSHCIAFSEYLYQL